MFTIRDDGALPGIAEYIPSHADGAEPTPEMIERFGRGIAEADLPIAATMGVWDDVRGLFDRLFLRRFLREEQPASVTMAWLECHVPPGGSAAVQSSSTSTSERSCQLKIFGSGLGAGRKATISLTSGSPARQRCTTFAFDVEVRPRVYELRGREMIELELVRLLGESIVEHDECDFCGVAPGDIDPFAFRAGEHLDLRRDSVPQKRTMKLAVEGSFSASIGGKVPVVSGISPELSLSAKVTKGMTLDIETSFPPGALYRGYQPLRPAALQTTMWAVERSVHHANA